MKFLLITAIVLLVIPQIHAQEMSIFGKWKTIDDESNKPRSIVEIYEKNGMTYGRIIKLFRDPGEDPDPLCDDCEGEKYNKRIIGMEIIEGMKRSDDVWKDGTILDPENGKVYRCKIWVENGTLKVRGYVMFLYRTQTWLKEI